MSIFTIVLCALILDAAFGEPRWLWSRLPHPAVLLGRLITFGEKSVYAPSRSAGALLVICLVLVVGAVGWALTWLGPVVEVLLIAMLLAQRSLAEHVLAVADALRLSVGDARSEIAKIVSRDTSDMGEEDIARAALETAAENLSDGVVAPLFWAAIAGLPGIMIYKLVNTADSMIGYRTPRYARFGWAAAKLDDVLNWVPARLTAAAVWLMGGRKGRWTEITGDARLHKSPNAGWPEAALARALDVALAGPRAYHGKKQDLPWVHPQGRRDIGAAEIAQGVNHLWRVWWLCVMICASFAIIL